MADFNSAIPFIQTAEGGLSRNLKDTASKNPAPWPYNGQSGWHTNRGITYSTFASMAPKLGYDITPANFFTMPDPIWNRIYKAGYWDMVKGDLINSTAVAVALVDYAFNFGPAGAEKRIIPWLKEQYQIIAATPTDVAGAINRLTASGDKDFFLSFMEHRKQAYIDLKQPANEQGWLERMDKLKDKGLTMLLNTVAAHPKTTIAGVAFFLLLH